MQTFMVSWYPPETAQVLDYKRLGKQRVECKQILNVLTGVRTGWKSHPAVRMWQGYEVDLCDYAIEMCKEWLRRGYKDTLLEYFLEKRDDLVDLGIERAAPPHLFDNPELYASHRSNLLRKDPDHYGQFGWSEPNNLPYVWPV